MSGKPRASKKTKLPARLTAAPEYRNIFAAGRRLRGECVNLLFLKRHDEDLSRWGIAVGRKFGNAVKRNRLRRMTRELVNGAGNDFPHGYTFVLEILSKANTFSRQDMRRRIQDLLGQAQKSLMAKVIKAAKT